MTVKLNAEERHAVDVALSVMKNAFREQGVDLGSPKLVKQYLALRTFPSDREVFVTLFLSADGKLLADRTMAEGTIDAVMVQPREIVKDALELNASVVVLAHSHPAADARPSDADIEATNKMAEALEMFGVRVHDHYVCARGECQSLKEYVEEQHKDESGADFARVMIEALAAAARKGRVRVHSVDMNEEE